MQQTSFQTTDGVTIVGNYLRAPNAHRAVLLLHMMPATKESWIFFQQKLETAGITSLAIDFRGHGESTTRDTEQLDYKNFSDAQQQEKMNDVIAGINYLKKQGFGEGSITIAGASIGANLSLAYLAKNNKIPEAILLSPGLDYRGIETDDALSSLAKHQRVLMLASDDDTYSFETIKCLAKLSSDQCVKLEYSGLGHGTTMLEKKPEIADTLIDWIEKRAI